MKISFYTGTAGTMAAQDGMNVIANNIANVNTAGYKAQKANFNDLLYSRMLRTKTDALNENLEVGHGAKLQNTDLIFTPGGLEKTGVPHHMMLMTNNSFFAVMGADEQPLFTRDGTFTKGLDEEGGVYLVDGHGRYVLDANFERILYSNYDEENGTLLNGIETENTSEHPFGVGVFSFPNQYELELKGENIFQQTERSGAAEYEASARVESGYVETSNVDTADEISQMIITQRAFQLNSKLVQTSVELEDDILALTR